MNSHDITVDVDSKNQVNKPTDMQCSQKTGGDLMPSKLNHQGKPVIKYLIIISLQSSSTISLNTNLQTKKKPERTKSQQRRDKDERRAAHIPLKAQYSTGRRGTYLCAPRQVPFYKLSINI